MCVCVCVWLSLVRSYGRGTDANFLGVGISSNVLISPQIKFEDRFKFGCFRSTPNKTCKLSVDGVDCPVYEVDAHPVNRRWYSHKFRSAGVRYEVGVCIQTGDICWINGPFMCGRWPDINIFRVGLKRRLNQNEMVVADKGYRGDSKCHTNAHLVSLADKRATNKALARHETVNKRVKQFKCLKNQFRHPLSKHKDCFYAASVATQVMFNRGHKPYKITY